MIWRKFYNEYRVKYVNRYLVKRDVISVEPSMNRVLELAVKYTYKQDGVSQLSLADYELKLTYAGHQGFCKKSFWTCWYNNRKGARLGKKECSVRFTSRINMRGTLPPCVRRGRNTEYSYLWSLMQVYFRSLWKKSMVSFRVLNSHLSSSFVKMSGFNLHFFSSISKPSNFLSSEFVST